MAPLEGFEPPTRRLEGVAVSDAWSINGFESGNRPEILHFQWKEAVRFVPLSVSAMRLQPDLPTVAVHRQEGSKMNPSLGKRGGTDERADRGTHVLCGPFGEITGGRCASASALWRPRVFHPLPSSEF